jgi:hypothetical protein
LIAGRTGQEFNQRKSRKGAYWEDRYHAIGSCWSCKTSFRVAVLVVQ